jgi:uncharacterized membrane protein YuzA (DUF378 family)
MVELVSTVLGMISLVCCTTYVGVAAAIALVATFSKRPSRRREARETLRILVRMQGDASPQGQ